MKIASEVSDDKIRGGFYSPEPLVDHCLHRVGSLIGDRHELSVIEPGAGDGAFVRGLMKSPLARQVGDLLAIELLPSEATKVRDLLRSAEFQGHVISGSVIDWASKTDKEFDVVVGNPPFVRYQFISPADKQNIVDLGERLGLPFRGVSNLWIPVLLSALTRLKPNGAFALIVPTECLTGVSAGSVRLWLAANANELLLDLFPPGSFPYVLQEVLIVSGRRREMPRSSPAIFKICDHGSTGRAREWSYSAPVSGDNWTRYLLPPDYLAALREAESLPVVTALGKTARFEVAAVTGANEYFSIDIATAGKFDLDRWTRPLLPRTRHAHGLVYRSTDHELTKAAGARALLLHFAQELPNPESFGGAREYLELGVSYGIPDRYKCRIRDPWYRVPHVRPGTLMMSKRSHRYHRVLINAAEVVTTDTIYRGDLLHQNGIRTIDLAAAFHNSLTLLSTELEGRSFGGGVLELVPSEIGRLLVPIPKAFGSNLKALDLLNRQSGDPESEERLVDETDSLLVASGNGISRQLIGRLRDARLLLMRRRLDRN